MLAASRAVKLVVIGTLCFNSSVLRRLQSYTERLEFSKISPETVPTYLSEQEDLIFSLSLKMKTRSRQQSQKRRCRAQVEDEEGGRGVEGVSAFFLFSKCRWYHQQTSNRSRLTPDWCCVWVIPALVVAGSGYERVGE